MNLRILKKLSKKAVPLLEALGVDGKLFTARRWDNYTGVFIGDRNDWERGPCHPTHTPWNNWTTPRGMPIKYTTRKGKTMVMSPPTHPRKGTPMVGGMVGYYEPEWEERTAWEELEDMVLHYFTDWSEEGATLLRTFAGPGDILRAAQEMIAERKAA